MLQDPIEKQEQFRLPEIPLNASSSFDASVDAAPTHDFDALAKRKSIHIN